MARQSCLLGRGPGRANGAVCELISYRNGALPRGLVLWDYPTAVHSLCPSSEPSLNSRSVLLGVYGRRNSATRNSVKTRAEGFAARPAGITACTSSDPYPSRVVVNICQLCGPSLSRTMPSAAGIKNASNSSFLPYQLSLRQVLAR
jgi:hypothetical protein